MHTDKFQVGGVDQNHLKTPVVHFSSWAPTLCEKVIFLSLGKCLESLLQPLSDRFLSITISVVVSLAFSTALLIALKSLKQE